MKMTIGRAVCVAAIVFHFSVNLSFISSQELTMPSCINGWTMAEEDKETVITCSHPSYNQTVLWRVEKSTSSHTLFEGSCAITQKNCTFSSNYRIDFTVDDASISSLVIKRTNVQTHGGAVVFCSDSKIHRKCSINVIHVPTLTQCKTEVNPGSRTVTGSCNIDKFFTYNNLASCGVTRRMGKTAVYNKQVEGLISLQDYTDSEDNKPYKQGNCSFTTHLPTAIGNYTYSIVVAPIQVGETVGKIEIETTCTLLDENCSWECLKQSGNTSNYVCNPSDRLRTSNVTSTTSSAVARLKKLLVLTSPSAAHLGSSSSAHYSSSQPVSLSSFTSLTVVSTATHVSSSVLTPVGSPPSTHESSSPSTRVSTSPTTHMSSPASTHVWSPPSTHVSSLLTHLASSPLVPLGSSTSDPVENRPPAGGNIVAGVLVALVVVIIVIVIIYIVKKKQNHHVAQRERCSKHKRGGDGTRGRLKTNHRK